MWEEIWREKSNLEEEKTEDKSGMRRQSPLTKIPLWLPPPAHSLMAAIPSPGADTDNIDHSLHSEGEVIMKTI